MIDMEWLSYQVRQKSNFLAFNVYFVNEIVRTVCLSRRIMREFCFSGWRVWVFRHLIKIPEIEFPTWSKILSTFSRQTHYLYLAKALMLKKYTWKCMFKKFSNICNYFIYLNLNVFANKIIPKKKNKKKI